MSYLICEACGHEHMSDLQRALDKYNKDSSIKLFSGDKWNGLLYCIWE